MLEHEEIIKRHPLTLEPDFSDQTVGVTLCLITNLGSLRFIETWTVDEKQIYILPKPLRMDDPLINDYFMLSNRYIQELRYCSGLTELIMEGCVLDKDLVETLSALRAQNMKKLRLSSIKYDTALLPFLPILFYSDAVRVNIYMGGNTVQRIRIWAGEDDWTFAFAEPSPGDNVPARIYRKLSNAIIRELRHCSALQELTISGRMVDRRLLDTINHLTVQNLTKLILDDVKPDKGMNLALQLPGYVPSPEIINLTLESNDWKWTGTAFEYQNSVLGLFNPNSLETLNMTGTWYVPFAYQFMGFIGGCPRLTHLTTVLTFDALNEFAYFLGQCPALKALTVTHTPRVPLVHDTDFAEFDPSVCPNLEELNVPAALLPHFYPLNAMRPRLETVTICDPYAVSYEHEVETQKRLVAAIDDPEYHGNQTVKRLHVGTINSTWKELRVALRRIYEMFEALESLTVWTYDTELSSLNGRKMPKSLLQLDNATASKNTYEAVLMDITPGIIDLPPALVELTMINHSPQEMDDEVEEAFLRCLNNFQNSPCLMSVHFGHQQRVVRCTRASANPQVGQWQQAAIGRCEYHF